MSIERMEFVSIAGLAGDLDKVLVKLSDCGCFHMESASKVTGKEKGFITLKEDNPFTAVLKQLSEITQLTGVKFENTEHTEIDEKGIDRVEKYVRAIRKKLDELDAEKKKNAAKLAEFEQALYELQHLQGIDADIQQILSCKYIVARFGKLPVDSFEKIPYYDDKLFFFTHFSEEKEYYWGVYFAPASCIDEIDEIFESLYFEKVDVPEYVHGNSQDAVTSLEKQIEDCKVNIEECSSKITELVNKELHNLNMIFARFKTQHDNFDLRQKAAVTNDKFYIVGFVPKDDSERFMKLFDDMKSVSVVMQPADANGKLQPPIKLKNSKFSQPFSMFVEMYGLPSYNGINPTTFVAITYTLMFGIMFGDLGQGIVLIILGALLWKWKKFSLGPIMTRIGFSSAIFGTLFGSVFGFEHLLDPMYEKLGISFLPFRTMESTTTVLIGAIGIGIVLILISIILNIIEGAKNKNLSTALFGNNGLAGLVFYGALLGGIVGMLLNVKIFNTPYIIFLIVLPLILMFLREPLANWVRGKAFHTEAGIGDFIASNFFEVFEFLLGYATNTLSFVRIGGFVLSHAGMMSVVMSLSETVSAGASPIVIIIGNAFVMLMEGMIVGIQVLRLEFYEMFSRFYDGDGVAFTPVKINYDDEIE